MILSSPPGDSAAVIAVAAQMPMPVVGILPMRHTGRTPALRAVLHRPLRTQALIDACLARSGQVSGTLTAVHERVPGHRVRALVVDDNPVNRRVAALHLRRLGCRARCARSGRRALAACLPGAFDLVLLDLGMPGLDGIATAAAIRDRLGDTRPLLVGCTAGTVDARRQACLDAGMVDLLAKPMEAGELARLVGRLRSGRGAEIRHLPAGSIPAAPSPMMVDATVLDLHVIERLRAMRDGDRLIRTLAAHVLDDVRVQPGRIQAALAAGDRKAAAAAAHRLLGSARAGGLRALATRAGAMERACHLGEVVELPELLTCCRTAAEALGPFAQVATDPTT